MMENSSTVFVAIATHAYTSAHQSNLEIINRKMMTEIII